jgi:predicted acylesterase/phospholipase RssA
MEEQGIQLRDFEAVYGTSVGGLIGLLVVIGMSHIAIHRLLMSVPIASFFRIRANGILTIADTGGIDSGNGLRRLIRSVLRRVTGKSTITLGELYQRYPIRFAVNALDVRTGASVILGTQETPDVRVEDALCATSAIPGLFVPVRIRDMVLVDGGVHDALMIHHVPQEDLPYTIAIAPIIQPDPPSTEIDLLFILRASFTALTSRSITQCCEDPRYKDHIIRILTPISSASMLSEQADTRSVRETLDFIGYTEMSRSDIVKTYLHTINNPPASVQSITQPALDQATHTPTSAQEISYSPSSPPQPTQPTQPSQPRQLTREVTALPMSADTDTSHPDLAGQPYQGAGLQPADQDDSLVSLDMTSHQPPDMSSGPSHSLPPPVDTRELAGPRVGPVTYRPTV